MIKNSQGSLKHAGCYPLERNNKRKVPDSGPTNCKLPLGKQTMNREEIYLSVMAAVRGLRMDPNTHELSATGIPIGGSELIKAVHKWFDTRNGELSYYAVGTDYSCKFNDKYPLFDYVFAGEVDIHSKISLIESDAFNDLFSQLIHDTYFKQWFIDNNITNNNCWAMKVNLKQLYCANINKYLKQPKEKNGVYKYDNIVVQPEEKQSKSTLPWIGRIKQMFKIVIHSNDKSVITIPVLDIEYWERIEIPSEYDKILKFNPYWKSRRKNTKVTGVSYGAKLYTVPDGSKSQLISPMSIKYIPTLTKCQYSDYYVLGLNDQSAHRICRDKGVFDSNVFHI